MRFGTRLIHEGQHPDPTTGSTVPPVYFTSTFTQAAPGEHKGYAYARSKNPTRTALEEALAAAEGAAACCAFGSGMAAESTLLLSLRPGDGIVAGHDLYGGTYRVMERVFRPWGLEFAYATGTTRGHYEAALATLTRPRMLWIETPTNPLLDITDIGELCSWARGHKLTTVVDNTFASPCLQQPLALGADFVVHSTTKYLGGHSDVVGGALMSRDAAAMEPVRFLQNAVGAVPGPMDSYLVHRGLKTLAVRMQRHCANAMRVAEWLTTRKGVTKVLYPGLPSHPGNAIARKQMCGFGGMISFQLDGNFESTKRFCSALKVFALAESLGGVESLCCHPATMTHASIPKDIREARGVGDTLVRLSVGIEDVEDLLEDLEQALHGVG